TGVQTCALPICEDLTGAASGDQQLVAVGVDRGECALDGPAEGRLPGDAAVLTAVGDGQQAVPGLVLGAHPHVHAVSARGEIRGVQTPCVPATAALQR